MGLVLKDYNKRIIRIVICILCIAVLVCIDQVTKSMAVSGLKDKEPISLIKGILELYYLPNGNTGAAFGMLQGHQTLFMMIAIIVCLALFILIYVLPFDKKYTVLTIVMTFIIAGGIGNMIDRIQLNYVIDFIYISAINFPIFNVADMYVSVCTVLLMILFLFVYKENDINEIEQSFFDIFKIKKKIDKKSE